jgi:hypothetical protein
MNSFVGQLPTLIGVVLGAVGTFFTTSRTQRAAFRRELSARWDERRLTAYAEYSRSQKTSINLAMRIAAYLGNDPYPHSLPPDEGRRALGAAAAAREPAWESVLLLGAADAVKAGREWNQAVWEMETFVKSESRDPDRWRQLWSEQDERRARFYSTARRDLSIPEVAGS